MKNKIMMAVAGLVLMLVGFALGQGINPNRNPNLFAAERHCHEAKQALDAAQHANEYDMGGHADNAKHLIDQAEGEIRAAAHYVDHR